MSFSKKVKEELSNVPSAARHCRIAELAAIVECCGRLIKSASGNKYRLCIQTESENLAERAADLLVQIMKVKAEVSVSRNIKNVMYTLEICKKGQTEQVCQTLKLHEISQNEKGTTLIADKIIVQNTCCKRCFIRGTFMSAGSVSDPAKAYHLEIVYTNYAMAEKLKVIINSFELDAKIVNRKKYYVVYLKEGSQIVDLLNVMEAHVALMEFENVRILKEVRNSVNRKVNCETANISKTVAAATKQMEDITFINETIGLGQLAEGLEEIARLRIAYPDATLKELGEMLIPCVGKSGVNHRLKKLGSIAVELREKEDLAYDNKEDSH